MKPVVVGQAYPETVINENFDVLAPFSVFGFKFDTSSGLTWHYYGGLWGGFTIGTGDPLEDSLTLAASDDNYIVVEIATGVVSVDTATTDWNDGTNYARAYKVTTGASGVASFEDYRGGPGGVFGGAGGGGGGGGAASAVTIADAGNFYASGNVEGALQEVGADLAALGTASTAALDTDGTLAANSDTRVPSQKAVKTYADQLIASADAMVFKGVIDCSANPNYPAADKGDTYRVSVAGKIGGASGVVVEVGDLLLCLADGTASGNQATVGSSWSIAQTNIDGAVIGPASATGDHFAQFDGTSGKLIKGGLALDTDGALTANSDTRVPSQKAVKTAIAAAVTGLGSGTVTHTGGALTAGQVIIGAGGGDVAALAAGTNTNVLTMVAGVPAWAAPSGGGASGINAQTGPGTYTLVLTDASKVEVQRSNASACSVTVPPNSSVAFPLGAQIAVRWRAGTAGQVSIVAGAGVTITTSDTLNLLKAGSLAVLTQEVTDEWALTGELVPVTGLTYKQLQRLDPANSTTAGTATGIVITSTATISHPTQALTNLMTAIRRIRWSTSASAGNASGFFEAVATKAQGNGAGLGGYSIAFRFGASTNVTGHQVFLGLGAAAALAGDPSALVTMIGMGYDAADASTGNWQLMRNDASGTATRVDLGSGAARNTTDLFLLTITAASNGSSIAVTVVNESTGTTVLNTTYNTDIPATNAFLSARVQVRNGALSSVCSIDLANIVAGVQE